MSPSLHMQDQCTKFKDRVSSLSDLPDHHAHLKAVSVGTVVVSLHLPLQPQYLLSDWRVGGSDLQAVSHPGSSGF